MRLHVDEARAGEVDIDTSAQEFLSQHGHVETVGVEAGDVASLEKGLYLAGYLGEGGLVAHVVVGNVVDGCGGRRYGHAGIDAIGFFLLLAIGENLQQADFHDAVVGDGSTCRLQVKEDDRLGEFQFHGTRRRF